MSRRHMMTRGFVVILLGALLGGVAGLALVEVILSPVFVRLFGSWGAVQLQQFLRHPLVYPLWLGLMSGLSFYFGGRLMLWLLWDRHMNNQENSPG